MLWKRSARNTQVVNKGKAELLKKVINCKNGRRKKTNASAGKRFFEEKKKRLQASFLMSHPSGMEEFTTIF